MAMPGKWSMSHRRKNQAAVRVKASGFFSSIQTTNGSKRGYAVSEWVASAECSIFVPHEGIDDLPVIAVL
ncbi:MULTISPECIES: hypothetical protein [unclassified Cupriavidus]|uniref:hypothetical protein n=1 Tax=Cupriavidus sp. H19C3 TaxID=3241603 RepID=UPI003BF90A88